MIVISLFRPVSRLSLSVVGVVVILGTSEVLPGASMATVRIDLFIFLWAAEQKISSNFVREFSDGRKRAVHIVLFDIKSLINPSELWETI